MSETAAHGLSETAAASFVNGNGAAAERPSRAARAPARDVPPGLTRRPHRAPVSAELPADPLGLWRERMARLLRPTAAVPPGLGGLGHEQPGFLGDAARDYLAVGRSLAAEADPARRAELAWAHICLRTDRCLATTARMVEHLGAHGSEIVEAMAPCADLDDRRD